MLNTVYDKVFFGERISSVFHTVYLETSILTKQQDWYILGNNSPLQDVAFKAIMLIPNLLLQKPGRNLKSKNQLKALKRLDLRKEELTELLVEGETIQKSLCDSKSIKTIAELSKKM